MTLREKVIVDLTAAMKAKDANRTSTLRLVKAAMMNRQIEKGAELDDEEMLKLLRSMVKQRRDSIEQFTKGGRQDLADKEAAEIQVLQAYLPAAADPAVIERAVSDAIAETGAQSAKDMGRVMKAAMAKLAGQTVDGKAINELVRSKLAST